MPTPHESDRPSPDKAKTSLRIGPRSLRAAGLDGQAEEVYKNDPRSKVWRVEHKTLGPVVVKQFTYNPVRQRLSLIVGVHPAQLELARNQQLQAARVPVIAIIDGGEERAGFGGRCWLATPQVGTSLQRLLTTPNIDEQRAIDLIDQAATLTRTMLDAGYTFKDLKPSNIVIEGAGDAYLIDVGSAKPDTTSKQTQRMLAVMDRVLKRDGVSNALRERFQEQIHAND